MPKPAVITLAFPTLGLVRRFGYQTQVPHSTPDAQNVRPVDVLEDRERGGSRPGLTKSYGSVLGGAVQCLIEIPASVSEQATSYLFGTAGGVPFLLQESGGSIVDSGAAITGTVESGPARIDAVSYMQKVYLADGGTAKVFDPSTGTVGDLSASAGTVPSDCTCVCCHGDRLIYAGPEHLWYMSARGNPEDWDYLRPSTQDSPLHPGSAIAGECCMEGDVGQPITALVNLSDVYTLIGCVGSLWEMRGDLANGGSIQRLSDSVGPINSSAWCELPDGSVMFISRSGIHIVQPGGGEPAAMSRKSLPGEFLDIDPDAAISMAYDADANGVHIFITPAAGTGQHWWIHLENGSFWPLAFGIDGLQPTAAADFAIPLSDRRRTILGCNDGYLRHFDDSSTDDDGTEVESYIVLGPVRTGSLIEKANVSVLAAVIDTGSSNVSWTLQSGDHSEEVVNSPKERASGSWSAGRSHWDTPKVSCGAFGVKLSSTGAWALESVAAEVRHDGPQK